MNWVDWCIIALLGINLLSGFRRGLVLQFVDIAGLLAGLYVAFRYYEEAANWLYGLLPITVSTTLCNLVSFIFLFVFARILFGLIGGIVEKFFHLPGLSSLNSLLGAFFGVGKGVIEVCAILLLLSAFQPAFLSQPLQNSIMVPTFNTYATVLYQGMVKVMPQDIPRIFVTTEGMQLRKMNFEQLDGATCIKCGGKVKFLGYEKNGKLYSPKFVCQSCGRVSDGCQTYEGYHLLYGKCPVEESKKGIYLNCDVWPNEDDVLAKGPCPAKQFH